MTTTQFLSEYVLGNPVRQWLIASGAATVALLAAVAIRQLFIRRFAGFAARTPTPWDDLIVDCARRTHILTMLATALWIGSFLLDRPADEASSAKLISVLSTIFWIVIAVQLAWWGHGFIAFLMKRLKDRQDPGKELPQAAFDILTLAAKVVLWSIAVLATLANLGVDVTTLVAGFGIGGVAIALAVQKILGDIFCSVSILMDKPFEAGDFIVTGDQQGTVERVGLKTTRVRSLSGEEIIFPNADLVGSRIQNLKRMKERRVVFTFGVLYQTPVEELEKIPGMVREIVTSIENTRLERVHFKALGDFALTFEAAYYVTEPDYAVYMDVQERINLELMRRCRRAGIGFAYPTQTVFLEKPQNSSEAFARNRV